MNSPKKVVIVGDSGVGKTKLLYEMLHIPYDTYLATIGVEVSNLRTPRGTINVWDTAGNDKFAGMRDGYYIGTDLFVIVCEDEEQERKWRSRLPAGNIVVFNSRKQNTSDLLDLMYM